MAMPVAAGQRREADLRGRRQGSAAAPLLGAPRRSQPLPVRMRREGRGLLVDLPVDVVVVLDVEERASRSEHRPGAACKVGLKVCDEHAFDCRAASGRNMSSIARVWRATHRIRIAKPFFMQV